VAESLQNINRKTVYPPRRVRYNKRESEIKNCSRASTRR